MSKAYLFAIMILFVPLTGCMDLDEETEDESSELEDAFNDWIDSILTKDWKKYCKYHVYTVDEKTNTIILANNTALDECSEYVSNEEWVLEYNDSYEYKMTVVYFEEFKIDEKAANNSGYVHIVHAAVEDCLRIDESEPWDCDTPNLEMEWMKVSGQWLTTSIEIDEKEPIANFSVEEDSDGVYHVEVVKISKQENLESFSFYLKDGGGSTYTGHSNEGFGEIAMQFKDGEEMGIDTNYSGNDTSLQSRATNVSNDDGSVYPVHFSDNDRDGKLSAGDQFLVYGKGGSDNSKGPAEDGWRLDILFEPSGNSHRIILQ